MFNIIAEAKRCLNCKNPTCQKGCPIHTPIPEVVRTFLNGDIDQAGMMLFENNPLSLICSLICNQEKQCEGNCILGKKSSPVLFSNIEHYKNNAPIEQSLYSTWKLLRMANIKRLHECPVTDKEIVDPQTGVAEKFVCLTPWVFEDGQPKQEPIAIYTVQCVSENEYGEDWVLIDGELPANNYDCREDALSFNEYKVIDDDGEEFIEQGIQKRLAPTKKQWDALKKLKEAFEECRNLGLRFFWDRDYNGDVQCINGEHICDFGYEHDFKHENGAEEVMMSNVVFANTGISFYDFGSEDPFYGIAMKATPRQTKQWGREHPDGKED